jgi:putative ABC transport system substrate-binding protein
VECANEHCPSSKEVGVQGSRNPQRAPASALATVSRLKRSSITLLVKPRYDATSSSLRVITDAFMAPSLLVESMSGRAVLLTLVIAWILGSITVACGVSHAQDPPRTFRVAFVNPHAPTSPPPGTDAFWERLRELGYVEGRNLVLDARWAHDRPERLPALVAEIAARKPDVIVTWGGVAARAAKTATTNTPIVAVAIPLAPENLARPGGNVTGLSLGYSNIAGKWLELLRESVPGLSGVSVIANPDNPVSHSLIRELQDAAPVQRILVKVIEVRERKALVKAFEQASVQSQAVLVLPDSVLNADAAALTALAASHRMPTMYSSVNMVDAGGLLGYGPDFRVQWRRAADYVHKILHGAKPAELPIEEPTEFRLRVNLGAAKALGLTLPESVLVRADEIVR